MAIQAETKEQRDQQRQYFVFEEICVVISTDGFDSADTVNDLTSGLYQSVATYLNQLAQTEPAFSEFGKVRPFDAKAGLFQNLALAGRRPGVLLRRQGGTGSAILFYRVALSTPPASLSNADRAKTIGDLAQLLNGVAKSPSARNDAEKWQIIGSSPNWIATACPDEDSGSPAAPPQVAPDPGDSPKKWTFQFIDPHNTPQQKALQQLVVKHRGAQTPSNVVVAILDTCPDLAAVNGAMATFPRNELLLEVADPTRRGVRGGFANPVTIDGTPATPLAGFGQVQEVIPDWQGWMLPWFAAPAIGLQALSKGTYDMPGHGLFSAGIIRDIAADAEIHLIRVLDDKGMGSLDTLVSAFSAVPDLKSGGKQLIVNASWTTSSAAKGDPLADEAFQIALAVILEWLGEQGILLVAAAGNNAFDETARPDPRYPARFDRSRGFNNVLSVAATELQAVAAALYTNNGSDTGVATVGGDAILNSYGQTEIEVENPSAQPQDLDAIKGIFWPDTLTINQTPNTTGWVCWAGTSFSTAIITAIAALNWAEDTTMTPMQLIRCVQKLAWISIPGLNVNAIYTSQVVAPMNPS